MGRRPFVRNSKKEGEPELGSFLVNHFHTRSESKQKTVAPHGFSEEPTGFNTRKPSPKSKTPLAHTHTEERVQHEALPKEADVELPGMSMVCSTTWIVTCLVLLHTKLNSDRGELRLLHWNFLSSNDMRVPLLPEKRKEPLDILKEQSYSQCQTSILAQGKKNSWSQHPGNVLDP